MKEDKEVKTKIRKDDTVIVLSGACKGQTGKVFRREGDMVFVQGLNKVKKHVKKSQQNQAGGILEIERPLHISKVCVVGKDNQPVKLRVRTTSKGQRELVYKNDGHDVVHRQLSNKNRSAD